MPHQRLQPLWTKALCDTPGSKEVAQRVQAVFLVSAPVDDTGSALCVIEGQLQSCMMDDPVAGVSGKHKVAPVDRRTGEPPFSQGVECDRRQRDVPIAAAALGRPDAIPRMVGTLPYLQQTLLEIDM